MNQIKIEIAVVGAGVAGLAAALALAKAGAKVALIRREAAPSASLGVADQPFDARVYALSANSRRLLDDLNIWSALDQRRMAPVYDMRVYPAGGLAAGSADELHFSAYEAQCEALATIVEQRNLVAVMEQAVGFSSIRTIVGDVSAFDNHAADRAVLTLADGVSIGARLVVAADGANSPLRSMAGIAVAQKPYKQRAIVAHLRADKPHRDQALQWFGQHGVLALLPMPNHRALHRPDNGKHVVSMVWSSDEQNARQVLADGPAELSNRLREITGARLGELQPLSDMASFELRLSQAVDMIAPRVALVGDAAHVVHPLAGQGLNLGLGDVADLAQLIAQARKRWRNASFDPGHELPLRAWRRHRAEPVLAMARITDTLQQLYDERPECAGSTGGDEAIRLVRDIGWRAFARFGPLRRQIIRYATDDR